MHVRGVRRCCGADEALLGGVGRTDCHEWPEQQAAQGIVPCSGQCAPCSMKARADESGNDLVAGAAAVPKLGCGLASFRTWSLRCVALTDGPVR